jgi:hypothetical protein
MASDTLSLANGTVKRIASRPTRLLLATLLLLISATPYSAGADEWDWSVTPYAWLIGTRFSTAFDIPEDGEQVFSDIVKNLDFAAQLHLEAERNGLGFMLDLTNLQLSDSTTQNNYTLNTDSSTTLLEAAVLLRALEANRSRTTLFAGVRALDVDLDLNVTRVEPAAATTALSNSATLTDFMVGARYQYALNDQWSLYARGDVASGDTDFSWNASMLAGRDIGKSGLLILGYRYLNVEFKRGDELLDPTLVVSGPMLGYSFRF